MQQLPWRSGYCDRGSTLGSLWIIPPVHDELGTAWRRPRSTCSPGGRKLSRRTVSATQKTPQFSQGTQGL